MAYLPPGYFPPPGYGMGYPPPGGGGVPSYPGPPWIQYDPRFQNNPSFDGLFSHGLTTSPYLNSQLEDVNMLQYQIYSSSGVGYMPPGMPPGMPYGMPYGMPPGMPMPYGPGMPPMFPPPGYYPNPKKDNKDHH